MAMAGGVFFWQANASTGEVTRAPLYVNVPRRRNYIPDLFPNLAVLAVLAGGIPHPAPEPQLTRRIAPQPDLSPNIALRLAAGLNIPALFEPPTPRKAQSPELFPNLAIATQAPGALIPAYAEPAQNRRTGLQPEIWPNIAVNLQTQVTRQGPEPTYARKLTPAPEIFPNIALRVPLAQIPLVMPVEPWINRRYPPQVEVFQNRPVYAPPEQKARPQQAIEPTFTKRLLPIIDLYPNITLRVPVVGILEIVPYMIEDTLNAALMRIASIYGIPNVIGTSGSVTIQSPIAFTLVPRGTLITITLGGTIKGSGNSRAQAPYGYPDTMPIFPERKH